MPSAIVLTLFFLSGFCGLLYEVIWLRLAMLRFGVISPVVSVVVSVFMAGLGTGSWLGGRGIGPLSRRLKVPPIIIYGVTEALIGLGAWAVPRALEAGQGLLLQQGASNSFAYLAGSSAVLFLSIFPWALLMGTTFPFMIAAVGERFSALYLANVIGGAAGALLSAFVLIELMGFHETLTTAARLNLLIALGAFYLAASSYDTRALRAGRADAAAGGPGSRLSVRALIARDPKLLLVLFAGGFCSMGMEVVWSRAFVGPLGSTVYAFATILAVYLVATFAGTAIYRRRSRGGARAGHGGDGLGRLLVLACAAGTLPALAGDTRLNLPPLLVALSLAPVCGLLGFVTPALVDEYAGVRADLAGFAYGVNVLGCILGPLVASYALLPFLSEHAALALLSLPFLGVAWALRPRGFLARERWPLLGAGALVCVSGLAAVLVIDGPPGLPNVTRHDYAGTVVSYTDGEERELIVNGVKMTRKRTVTKLMAHIPMMLHEPAPKSVLIICFGMGTSFRSALTWGARVTAVELIPSVPKAFTYYHSDGEAVLRDPNGSIVIDDGRRFLLRTHDKYDVIVIDPPPPVDAAASGMLYSSEFYEIIKAHLAPGGILQQWTPDLDPSFFMGIASSLLASFPNVRIYPGIGFWGAHFLASLEPIAVPSPARLLSRMPARARQDLAEWSEETPLAILTTAFARPFGDDVVRPARLADAVTDDEPVNEYHLLRGHR